MRGQYGGIAQLVEYPVHTRLVTGSNPVAATISGPLVKWLRHRPFTAVTWVRVPYGSPQKPPESQKDSGGFFQFPGSLRPPSAAAPGRDTRRHGVSPPLPAAAERSAQPALPARPAPDFRTGRFPGSPGPLPGRKTSAFPRLRRLWNAAGAPHPPSLSNGAGRFRLRKGPGGAPGPSAGTERGKAGFALDRGRFGSPMRRAPAIPPHRFSRLPDAPSGRADAFRVSAARRLRPLPLPGYFSAARGSSNLPSTFL